jgi:hypothetical protein
MAWGADRREAVGARGKRSLDRGCCGGRGEVGAAVALAGNGCDRAQPTRGRLPAWIWAEIEG